MTGATMGHFAVNDTIGFAAVALAAVASAGVNTIRVYAHSSEPVAATSARAKMSAVWVTPGVQIQNHDPAWAKMAKAQVQWI